MSGWSTVSGAVRGAAVLAALAFGMAAPAAEASRVLRVQGGKARMVDDRLLPPRSRTALPTLTRTAAGERHALAAGPAAARAHRRAHADRAWDLQHRAGRRQARPRRTCRCPAGRAERRDRDRSGHRRARASSARAAQRGPDDAAAQHRVLAGATSRRRRARGVVFAGSPVILEYYPGRGLQIQPLANFGKANAAWSSCRSRADRTCTTLRTTSTR